MPRFETPGALGHRRPAGIAALAVLLLLTVAGCAGTISPQSVRRELVRQTGAPPEREFELTVGRTTTALLKAALGPRADGRLPLAGLTAIELAVYGLPTGRNADPLDFSEMTPWRWENVVRYKHGERSALVMIRSRGGAIRDLALIVAGSGEVLYGRLRGELPSTLPESIRQAVAADGTVSLKRQLFDAAGQNEP